MVAASVASNDGKSKLLAERSARLSFQVRKKYKLSSAKFNYKPCKVRMAEDFTPESHPQVVPTTCG